MSKPTQQDLVKLYYRIGEVSQIVGVQPHVLRYWESEFRTIRPQKSSKGQRVYSRKDVEKLLRVKDLLKNQGFTIAGARKQLIRRGADEESKPVGGSAKALPVNASAPVSPSAAPGSVASGSVASGSVASGSVSSGSVASGSVSSGSVSSGSVSSGSVSSGSVASGSVSSGSASAVNASAGSTAPRHQAKALRRTLVHLRNDIVQMLDELDAYGRPEAPRRD